MKKFLLALIGAMLLFAACAFAESAPADGLYTIGVSSNAKMFKIMDCILRVEDGKMTAVLTMSGSGYGYLYQGTSAEADAAPVESWTPYFENADGKHRFAIEIPVLDEEIPMAAWSIRYEKWYDRTLVFFSDTMSPYCEVAPDGVYSAQLISDTDLNGKDCILHSKDGEMTIESDSFSMEIPSLDTRVPVKNGWLKIDSQGLLPCSVCPSDGVYRTEVQTDSALLRFTDCLLTVKNGKMIALLTARNNNYDFIYPGPAEDALQNESGWIAAAEDAEGHYTYLLELPSLDNEIPIATHSAKKKLWYDRTIYIDSAALVPLNENP